MGCYEAHIVVIKFISKYYSLIRSVTDCDICVTIKSSIGCKRLLSCFHDLSGQMRKEDVIIAAMFSVTKM